MTNVLLPSFTDAIDQRYFIEPLNGPTPPKNYLDRFPDEVYNKSIDSHLVRFLYTLLGPAGIGWLRKNLLDARLVFEAHGLELFDIERFYGDPLSFGRILDELYDIDPTGLLPRDQWDLIKARDEAYRARAIKYVQGARLGNSPGGISLVAQSGLGYNAEAVENYRYLYDLHGDDPLGLPYYGQTASTGEFIIRPRPETSRSEVQTITISGNPTGGYFTLVFNGHQTGENGGYLYPYYAPLILGETGLVSYYRLGEASGTTAADSKGTNPGTYTGGVTLGQTGALTGDSDTAAQFSTGNTQYVDINSATLRGLSRWTVEAWVYPTAAQDGGVITNQFGGANVNFCLGIGAVGGVGAEGTHSKPVASYFAGGGWHIAQSAAGLSLNTWYHLVATYDGTNITLYVNGSQVAQTASATAPGADANTHVYIAGDQSHAIDFAGRIDEVAVYNVALSAAQISNHYQMGVSGSLITIPYNASSLQVQAALANLPNIGSAGVHVTGGPFPSPYKVHFGGPLSHQDVPQLQAISSLTGGSPSITVTTEQGGVDASQEIIAISPELRHNLQTALDYIRPVPTIPSLNSGGGTKTRQDWQTAMASNEYTEVLRFVTGSSSVAWPTVDSTHWIQAGVENEAPRVKDDRQHHYVGFHNVANVSAYTDLALADTNYELDSSILANYNSVHVGPFSPQMDTAIPFFRGETDPTRVYSADRVLADYAEPLTVTAQADDGTPLVNGIYPSDYASLSGIAQIKYKDDQFWSSMDRTSGAELLEIDFGSVQAVNFITFEAIRKPVDFEFAYETFDQTPRRHFVNVTPDPLSNWELSLHYDPLEQNPWYGFELHFSDSEGQMIFTRYIRIKISRRQDSNIPSPSFLFNPLTQVQTPWAVELRNLRIGRNVVT